MRPHMYPQTNMRERRGGGQPPLTPHVLGMAQQPGMIMSIPNQPVQIMTQGQGPYNNQGAFSTGGQGFVPQQPQQQPPYQTTYGNPQVVLTKQAVNHKNYKREYIPSVVKQNSYGGERNASGYNSYTYNGKGSAQARATSPSSTEATTAPTKMPMTAKQEPSVDSEKEEDAKGESSPSPTEVTTEECTATTASTSSHPLLSNMKEKTPMCLINELARFNKITHQYRLTNEQGPAHMKSFTVTLTLGNEEYTSEGPSIKKAQHSAAAEALCKTSFPHPTPKNNKNIHPGKSNITPTVELNALAMKRGEPAVYKMLDPPPVFQPLPTFTFRRPYGVSAQRNGRMPLKPSFSPNLHYTVSLKVGSWEFFGEGNSPQSARHDAASKALAQLKLLPLPDETTCPAAPKENVTAVAVEQDLECLVKSPISLVHEVALKRNMNVLFQVVSEKGPPHMKTFVTRCQVGELTASGEGNGKKVSKKRAAESMMLELRKLPPLSPSLTLNALNLARIKRKPAQAKKKSRNLIKIVQDQKPEPEASDEINPISRLIQIQQVKKEKEPVYTLIEERGMPRRREFVMEVAVSQLKATGVGPNKKLAKKAAAQNLLTAMGYSKQEAPTAKPAAVKQETPAGQDQGAVAAKERKAPLVEGADKPDGNATNSNGQGGSSGRQLVPGLLLMSEQSSYTKTATASLQTTATIAKELLKGGNSPTADALVQKATVTHPPSTSPVTHVFRPKEQLLYLADLLHFQVQFSDFPKGNHSEFLSLVSLSTDPPQVCHGAGPSVDESHDQAALTALRALSEMGLDSVTQPSPAKDTSVSKSMPTMKK